MSKIFENYKRLRQSIPENVTLVVVAKTRTVREILEIIDAGATNIGENYVQEAEIIYGQLGERAKKVRWHMMGHLQRNKVKKAVELFDMIGSVDSLKLAKEIDKRCEQIGKVMSMLVEVNSGRERQKSGVLPEKTENLIRQISKFGNIRVMGLMTMGPRFGNPKDSRPYFIETKKIFDKIEVLNLPNVEMKYLSMGMTNSYKVAIEEGSNMVRIGTAIFGSRES